MDRRTATTYFAIQGVAGIVWWVLLFTTDLVRDLFFVDAAGWDAGRSILIADVAMFAGASLVTAWLVATSSSLARPGRRGSPWALLRTPRWWRSDGWSKELAN